MRYLLLILLLLASCQTAPTKRAKCPEVELLGKPSERDIVNARQGCARFLGRGSCLIRLEQHGPRRFSADCQPPQWQVEEK